MRKAAWFEVVTGLWLASIGCLPQQELSAYSAGPQASGAPVLEPGLAPIESPGALPEAATEEMSPTPVEPVDTPADTDVPAQPDQLAPAPPAPTESSTMADDTAGEMAPAPEPAPAEAAPTPVEPEGVAPVPLVADPPPPVPAQFRFVRLVADSEFNGGPLSSAAELDVFGADGQPLDRTGWIATSDSAEPTFVGGAPAALAIDGLPASVWHTAWFQLAAPPPHPHFLQLDLGQPRTVTGFRYVARQDVSVGRVADYRFYVSADGVEWGEPILAGRLQDSPQAQDVRIAAP